MGNELQKAHISALLTTNWLGRSYQHFPEIGSTNVAIRQADSDGAVAEGTIFITEYQSAGKGRLNRKWEVPKETSLLFSLLFRPNWPAERAQWLTMVGCLAVIEAIETLTAVTVKIKWPNDLVLWQNDVWHKFVGILVEGEVVDGQMKTAVIGIGINVNIPAHQLPQANTPPTSLMVAVGEKIGREKLLATILNKFEPLYNQAHSGESPLEKWKEKLITIGQNVTVTQLNNHNQILGIAVDIDPYGQLIVQDQNGQKHTVQAGDVTLRNHIDI